MHSEYAEVKGLNYHQFFCNVKESSTYTTLEECVNSLRKEFNLTIQNSDSLQLNLQKIVDYLLYEKNIYLALFWQNEG